MVSVAQIPSSGMVSMAQVQVLGRCGQVPAWGAGEASKPGLSGKIIVGQTEDGVIIVILPQLTIKEEKENGP